MNKQQRKAMFLGELVKRLGCSVSVKRHTEPIFDRIENGVRVEYINPIGHILLYTELKIYQPGELLVFETGSMMTVVSRAVKILNGRVYPIRE